MNYINQKNYIKIDKFSKTISKIRLTENQRKLIQEVLFEILDLQKEIESIFDFNKNLFLIPILFLEGESSSLIEGTRTMIEDFAYDVKEINNIPQWNSRNLINIYEQYILSDYYFEFFEFSSSSIKQIHLKLYENDPNSKFKMIFDTTQELKRVKPGQIISDDKKPNFIGNDNNLQNANLIMIRPSEKKAYLDDLFSTIQKKIKNNAFLIDHIIISHVIFEGIHPFNDGNGRIGRLLLSWLFKKFSKHIDIPIYLSEAFSKDKNKYKEILLNVQLKNDYFSWNKYISYFIDCILFTKKQLQNRIIKMIILYKKVISNKKVINTPIRKKIIEYFFKYIIINKELTIKKLKKDFPSISIQTIYKDWNMIEEHLNIFNNNDGYYKFSKLLEILREVV